VPVIGAGTETARADKRRSWAKPASIVIRILEVLMKKKNDKGKLSLKGNKNKDREKKYIPPEVITYSSKEILELLGPAMACVTPI